MSPALSESKGCRSSTFCRLGRLGDEASGRTKDDPEAMCQPPPYVAPPFHRHVLPLQLLLSPVNTEPFCTTGISRVNPGNPEDLVAASCRAPRPSMEFPSFWQCMVQLPLGLAKTAKSTFIPLGMHLPSDDRTCRLLDGSRTECKCSAGPMAMHTLAVPSGLAAVEV